MKRSISRNLVLMSILLMPATGVQAGVTINVPDLAAYNALDSSEKNKGNGDVVAYAAHAGNTITIGTAGGTSLTLPARVLRS